MKVFSIDLMVKGPFSATEEFQVILKELNIAITSVVSNSPDKFIINPTSKGNGVFPIKNLFVNTLKTKFGWLSEQSMSIVRGVRPGPIDAIKNTSHGIFAVEWETGNISSSHRALNKIAVGIQQKHIIGGILVLPRRKLAQYLTDRVGNYEEIVPYLSLYKSLLLEDGVLGVIAIGFDDVSNDVPLIIKGKDGNAKKKIDTEEED